MKKKTHGTVPKLVVGASIAQLKDIQKTMLDVIPNFLSHSDAQSVIGEKNNLLKDMRLVWDKYVKGSLYDQQLLKWQDFYREFFGKEVDISKIAIPEKKADFTRLVVIAEGLTLNQVFKVCQSNFPCWKYTDDLDESVTQNDRTSDQTYAIWVRDTVEADEKFKNMSANDLKAKGIKGITLLERMILELGYFKETGKHLDIENITLCSGSRDSGGSVLFARWHGDEFYVDWCHPDNSNDDLRCREVVTL